MNKEQSVIEFYVLCNTLKNIVRTGWKDWGVTRERIESIAEHIYGVQMLAISMWSQYGYDLDIKKVLSMLALHELEETIIGDLTQFQIDRNTKTQIGHEAIHKILNKLAQGHPLEQLILEFDERTTPEAQFAYQCDKLECDLQCKIYDEENCVDLNNQSSNPTAQDKQVKDLLDSGLSWSEMWITFDQQKNHYDKNFLAVSNYAITHNLHNNENELSESK